MRANATDVGDDAFSLVTDRQPINELGFRGDAAYIVGRLERYKIGWLWGLMTVTARRGS